MAQQTKIFTGMEGGPEAIEKNFGLLNAETTKAVGSKTVDLNVTASTAFSSGKVTLSRIGNVVFLTANVDIASVNITGTVIEVSRIPYGYKPSRITQLTGMGVGLSHISESFAFKYSASEAALKMVISKDNSTGMAQLAVVYQTNDDFPS